ncbi:hypothetical protein N7462_003907 [Penicillium macrosclerotiorum]|uniref:uncharacterized protein n=1 Tax=Penicillium macrosclerotiorum TaxID=303699 RepID=UPI0025484329|nr:uncharacterized protein N7462_003907 [Penicillium macrosclerotiorum]KAJ5689515.1 hypothetical protein N7462_003907 [Penicillium macrosclerotiorum]
MPHTSRKKRPTVSVQKRLQVTDDDGWTHVTSGSNVRRVMRTSRVRGSMPTTAATITSTTGDFSVGDNAEPVFGPAEAPSRLTLEELQAQYHGHRERWESSKTWARLQVQLDERAQERGGVRVEEEKGSSTVRGPVDAVVCIGLGSPSGFLRDGWVDRRSVSMYQLAALESIKNQLMKTHTAIPFSFPIYAQDPVFNALDTELLTSLGITVIAHPAAFDLITPNTLLFCPGAERKHLEQLLSSDPCMVFGGPLENAEEAAAIQAYARRAESRALVPFEAQEHAFWETRLYYRAGVEEDEKRG